MFWDRKWCSAGAPPSRVPTFFHLGHWHREKLLPAPGVGVGAAGRAVGASPSQRQDHLPLGTGRGCLNSRVCRRVVSRLRLSAPPRRLRRGGRAWRGRQRPGTGRSPGGCPSRLFAAPPPTKAAPHHARPREATRTRDTAEPRREGVPAPWPLGAFPDRCRPCTV